MDRLTKKGVLGEIECSFVNVPFQFNFSRCEENCNECDISEFIDRLGQYEDEAEQREKGCDFCYSKTTLINDGSIAGSLELYKKVLAFWSDDEYIPTFIVNYCPMCGRKLVE